MNEFWHYWILAMLSSSLGAACAIIVPRWKRARVLLELRCAWWLIRHRKWRPSRQKYKRLDKEVIQRKERRK